MTDPQALLAEQAAEVTQADRDNAGELWLACGNDIPEAHDGTSAALLETMAIAFAEARQSARRDALEEAAKAADAYEADRIRRADSGNAAWGSPIIQRHKAVSAMAIGIAIRALIERQGK